MNAELATAGATSARPRHRLAFAVLTVSVASFTLLQSMVVPVLAELQSAFDTDQTTVTWVLTAYLLSASICTPLLGRLGDVKGNWLVLTATLTLLSLGSLVAALAPNIGVLIAARVIQGVGGGVLPLSFSIILDEFPRDKVNTALSVIASLAAVGFGIGIVVAGPIVETLSIDWLFWLPMIATAAAALGAWRFVPKSLGRRSQRLPLLPAILLTAWLVALLLGLSQGGRWGWNSVVVLGLFATAVVVAVVWVVVEIRAPVPLIDMSMMRLRGMWAANVVAVCVGFANFACFGFLPQMIQAPPESGYGLGASITTSGRVLLPAAIGSFFVGFVTARLVKRLGARAVIGFGCLMNASAFASIAFFHDSLWQLYGATCAQGVGSGLVFSSLAGVVIASVPADQTGVASGINANVRTIGGSVGTAVMAGVVTGHVGRDGVPLERGYVIGFALLAAYMVVAAAGAALLPDIHDQPTRDGLEDADNAALGTMPVAASRAIGRGASSRNGPALELRAGRETEGAGAREWSP